MNNPWTDIELQTYEAHMQDTDEGLYPTPCICIPLPYGNTIHEQLQKVELTHSMLSIEYSLSKRMI